MDHKRTVWPPGGHVHQDCRGLGFPGGSGSEWEEEKPLQAWGQGGRRVDPGRLRVRAGEETPHPWGSRGSGPEEKRPHTLGAVAVRSKKSSSHSRSVPGFWEGSGAPGLPDCPRPGPLTVEQPELQERGQGSEDHEEQQAAPAA